MHRKNWSSILRSSWHPVNEGEGNLYLWLGMLKITGSHSKFKTWLNINTDILLSNLKVAPMSNMPLSKACKKKKKVFKSFYLIQCTFSPKLKNALYLRLDVFKFTRWWVARFEEKENCLVHSKNKASIII